MIKEIIQYFTSKESDNMLLKITRKCMACNAIETETITLRTYEYLFTDRHRLNQFFIDTMNREDVAIHTHLCASSDGHITLGRMEFIKISLDKDDNYKEPEQEVSGGKEVIIATNGGIAVGKNSSGNTFITGQVKGDFIKGDKKW